MSKTTVVSEFAPLKTVVLSRSQFCFPEDPENSKVKIVKLVRLSKAVMSLF
ncbi:hypothetical protein [Tetragenococcus muriaticus]|uniref:Uncharacterized protein n=1 Tax=Tetragenococcus muriaticus 3MR10-3 TaxID=1302648 RepID=A0A091C0M6_9ENTE|nr:hypothetical protein [Tetragenococcus muriaticus]KFN90265.1 hypothetical protein TMU3MR103_1601 [Tetragenococcus muriaticus 3MR10-3]